MKKWIATLLCAILSLSFAGCWLDSPGDASLTLAWDFNVREPVFQKVIAEYNKLKPDVTIKLDQKEGSTYSNWLSNQLSLGKTTADVVISMGVDAFFNKNKFVDFSQYLNKPNPYADNQIWKTVMDPTAYAVYTGSTNGQIYQLNTEQVITAWFYNEDMFEEMGVEQHIGKKPQEWNFDDLLKACEFIKSKGKTPLAIGGDYSGFWSYQLGWMFRVYADQYFRDMEESVVSVPGDYNYDEELQTAWFFDPTDKFNDVDEGYVVNMMRLCQQVMNGETGPDSEKYREMVANLSKLVPVYAPDGFTAVKPSDAAGLFIKGDAAIYIDQLSFYAGIERTFADNGVKGFDVGVFRYPPMTGENVGVNYTRDTGGARGNYSIIAKDKKKTDLAVDFMMYFLSPQGQTVYLKAMEEENVAPSGVPLVHDTEMPEKWKGKYDFEYPGSADSNKLGGFSRGFMDYAESVRDFVESSQNYFGAGKLTLDAYVKELQANCQRYVPYWLRSMGYKPDAWKTPHLNPVA